MSAAAKSATGAGKNDIDDLEPVRPADASVIEIAEFAVHSINAGLSLVGVVGGFRWVAAVGGSHYALIIETQDFTGATFIHKVHVLVLETHPRRMELIWYKY